MTVSKATSRAILDVLSDIYPQAKCELTYSNPFELLVATVLSAQCTDKQVNKVTPNLFAHLKTPEDFANASLRKIEGYIKSTGFYKSKAVYLHELSKKILERFDGKVPRSMQALITLKGVARKTANVVLYNAFAINEGIAVDTHVKRLSQRLGLSEEGSPEKIEKDLMNLFEREDWGKVSHTLVLHGRRVCYARKPDCRNCKLFDVCPRVGVK